VSAIRSHPAALFTLGLAVLAFLIVVLWFAPIALLFAAPWIAATAWVVARRGLGVLLPPDGRTFPSQADQVRGFRGSWRR